MRESERIKRICNKLEEAWSKAPNQRLGQFLLNVVFGGVGNLRVFLKEDHDIEALLENFNKGCSPTGTHEGCLQFTHCNECLLYPMGLDCPKRKK